MSRGVIHLKDELRQTFTIYVLIPTFVIAIFVLILAFAYWNTNVIEQNQNRLSLTCNKISAVVSGYLDKAVEIASFCEINQLHENKATRIEMYERFYQYINNSGVQADFYLFDNQMNRLISNQTQDPEFAQLARAVDWGIIGQIKRNPTVPNLAFGISMKNVYPQMDLIIGKAILEKGIITGYVLFVIPETQLLRIFTNPYVHFVIKDRYDYIPICTDKYFCDSMNKMKPELKSAEGYYSSGDRKYYIGKSEILNGELTVYALTSVGGIVNQLTDTLLVLMGVLLILSVSIVISVKKQVEEKTKMIDQLVEAFSAVKNGNLDMQLSIETNNEFQIIGEAYNMMLCSLKELMHTNHEKARATVISEIKQLESQFNPHFLFNTLENIKYMIKLDPTAANKMIVALSNLLRYSISTNNSEVTIQEDMAYTQSYLDIQKYRFGQRLNYIIHVPQELNNCIVPKLVIQPIIENAVKYGFRTCQYMLVEIKIDITDNQLVILIKNNGTEIDEQLLGEIRSRLASAANCSQHSGLYNVQRRIQLMYGEAFGLEIMSNRKEGTTVKIVLPIHKH
jgi:two-component system, sensor histidine kinase YesM